MTSSGNRQGAAFMVAAMAAFAVEDALFKTATQTIPVALALLIFGGVGLALFATLAHLRGDGVAPRGGFTRGLAIRSAFEVTGRLFFGLSLAFGDLSTTSAILQATPLVVVLGAVVVFGETVGWRRWTAILLGLVGVLMVLQPTGASLQPTAVFALLGMLGFAGRDLATRAAPPKVTNAQLGTLGFAMLVVAGLVLQAVTGTPLAVPPAADLLRLTTAAVFGVLAYSALTAAMRSGEVSVVTPFRYTRLVFALILAVTLFGERPDTLMLAGSALIVASGLFTLSRARRRPA